MCVVPGGGSRASAPGAGHRPHQQVYAQSKRCKLGWLTARGTQLAVRGTSVAGRGQAQSDQEGLAVPKVDGPHRHIAMALEGPAIVGVRGRNSSKNSYIDTIVSQSRTGWSDGATPVRALSGEA